MKSYLEKFASKKTSIIICNLIFNIFVEGIVELTATEDNDIAIAERTIRDTINNLFTAFKVEDLQQNIRLKQYSTIHNFFASITLTDCDNLKQISRLTRVNDVDNNTIRFIALLNEVLDDSNSNEANESDVYVTAYIETFIKKLRDFKKAYGNNRNLDDNGNDIRLLHDSAMSRNVTENVFKMNDSEEHYQWEKGLWQPSARRIYHGRKARIKDFPFMASVLFFRQFYCGGSIIKSDLVISSASCLQLAWNNRYYRENPAFLSVQVGSDYAKGGGENIGVLEIYFHPNYNPRTLKHNLAIMRLSRRIYISYKSRRVKWIAVDRTPWPLNIGRVTIIGWGARDRSNIVYTKKLAYDKLYHYPLRECQEVYSKDYVTDRNFCAISSSKRGGACNRDVGGPGIIYDRLVGVISFGPAVCGDKYAPTVFTRLSLYTEWIDSIMSQKVPHNHIKWPQGLDVRYPYVSNTAKPTLTPIIGKTTQSQQPIEEIDYLRVLQSALNFKDILSTVFGNDKDTKESNNALTQTRIPLYQKGVDTELNEKHGNINGMTEIGRFEPDKYSKTQEGENNDKKDREEGTVLNVINNIWKFFVSNDEKNR